MNKLETPDVAPADEHAEATDDISVVETPDETPAPGDEAKQYTYPEDPSKAEAAPAVDQKYTYPAEKPAEPRAGEDPASEGDPYEYTGKSGQV